MTSKAKKTKVSLVKTSDRESGIKKAIELLAVNPVKGKDVLLKPNFNTADPFPGSTHNETLIYLIVHLKKMGAKSITVGERSGPPDTKDVLKEKGIYNICKRLAVGLINFEELPPDGWIRMRPEKSHWRDGFDVAKPVLDSKCIVMTCCLKTHDYGGVFTMSLKMEKKIFEQEQIARAVELGLGIHGPEDIEIITEDAVSKKYADRLKGILLNG